MPISNILWFLVVATLASCSQQFKERGKSVLPNLELLRTTKTSVPSSIRKISELNGLRDSVEVVGAGKEECEAVLDKLGLFNKPVFADQYEKTILEDSQSNLTIERWKAKTAEAPIQQLEIYFNEETQAWYTLKAVFVADNLLFKKEEVISVGMDPISARVEEISVIGNQKMVFFEEDNYSIELKLLYSATNR